MLVRRCGIYYFRYKLPLDLKEIIGQSEIKKSLTCKNKFKAIAQSQDLNQFVLRLLETREAYRTM